LPKTWAGGRIAPEGDVDDGRQPDRRVVIEEGDQNQGDDKVNYLASLA
jgi:hypothetical protein